MPREAQAFGTNVAFRGLALDPYRSLSLPWGPPCSTPASPHIPSLAGPTAERWKVNADGNRGGSLFAQGKQHTPMETVKMYKLELRKLAGRKVQHWKSKCAIWRYPEVRWNIHTHIHMHILYIFIYMRAYASTWCIFYAASKYELLQAVADSLGPYLGI